jgi:hypothetical protein
MRLLLVDHERHRRLEESVGSEAAHDGTEFLSALLEKKIGAVGYPEGGHF